MTLLCPSCGGESTIYKTHQENTIRLRRYTCKRCFLHFSSKQRGKYGTEVVIDTWRNAVLLPAPPSKKVNASPYGEGVYHRSGRWAHGTKPYYVQAMHQYHRSFGGNHATPEEARTAAANLRKALRDPTRLDQSPSPSGSSQ